MKVIKCLTSLIIIIAYTIIEKIYYPIITNEIAIQQLNNTSESFTNYASYQNLWMYGWIAIVVIILIIYAKEIKKYIIKIKGEK